MDNNQKLALIACDGSKSLTIQTRNDALQRILFSIDDQIADDELSHTQIDLLPHEALTLANILQRWARPTPLRRITTMSHEEFSEAFTRGYYPTFTATLIADMATRLGLHQIITYHGQAHTYPTLVDMGFDVTFSLDRVEEKNPTLKGYE